jgi:hypothetical protein
MYSSSAALLLATQSDYNSSSTTAFSQLTDHNRQPLNLTYEVIDKAARMADGTMRKYVVAKKRKVSVSWQELPSGTGVPVSDYDVIQLTPSTVADVWTNSTGNTNTVTPGQTYTATANIRRTSSSTANAYIRIDWYNASNILILPTIPGTSVSINNNSWSQLSVTATAPTSTAYAIVTINATPASITDYIYVKSVTFAGNSVATSRFVAGTNTTISLTYLLNLNSGYTLTVDGNKGGAWMKAFYENNLFKPVRVRLVYSKDNNPITASSGPTASAYAASSFYPSPYVSASANSTTASVGGYDEFWAFMDSFSYDVTRRYTTTDIVNVSMTFTEI